MEKIIALIELFFRSIIGFPATFMHEFMHALVAIIFFSKIKEINLIPKIEFSGSFYHITYGYVKTIPRLIVFNIPISLAPFLNLILFFIILVKIGVIEYSIEEFLIIKLNYSKLFALDWFEIYLLIELFLAGFPSREDFFIAFKSLFSLSSIIFLIILIGGIYVYRHPLPFG